LEALVVVVALPFIHLLEVVLERAAVVLSSQRMAISAS
jgi:hypothetical protein